MPPSSKSKGDALEARVVRLLRKCGHTRVRTHVFLKDTNNCTSEIDVVYGRFFRRYVECKNYNDMVPLDAVAKFKEVLRMNGIPLSRGLFITTSRYSPRAAHTGVTLVDGDALRAWERNAWWMGLARRGSRLAAVGALAAPVCAFAWPHARAGFCAVMGVDAESREIARIDAAAEHVRGACVATYDVVQRAWRGLQS